MASSGINFSNFTLEPEGVRDLRKLIMLATLTAGDFANFHQVMPGVQNGDHVGGIGAFSELGLPGGTSCTPTYNSNQMRTVENTWVLGDWEVAEKICFKDIEATAARYSLKTKTDIADLTGTDILAMISPQLEAAIKRMVWRVAWFGDTAAALISGGGRITAGKNVNLFTIADGYWKKIFAIVAADPLRKTTIAANAQATYALQNSAFTNGIEVIDNLIYSAPINLRNATRNIVQADGTEVPVKDGIIMCTRSVTDAYEKNLTGTGVPATQIQWETGINGMQYFKRKGVDIYPIDLWDTLIQEFENTGTSWNSPHRAVFTTTSNLLAGTPSTDMIANLQTWFSQDDQDVKMLARDKIGLLIMDSTLIQVAY